MWKHQDFWKDSSGYAEVEATILFPILIMIFAGLVLLAMYIPTRGALQEATQYAATAIATERGDTWLYCDPETGAFSWHARRDQLDNVYVSLLKSVVNSEKRDDAADAERLTQTVERHSVLTPAGELEVEYGFVNYIVYQEVVVTATRTIPMPVDLSFVGFPTEIPVTVTSTAVVQNGDEFVRNIDLAGDFLAYLDEKYNISEVFSGVTEFMNRFRDFIGI